MSRQLVRELLNTTFYDSYKPSHQLGPDYVLPTEETYTWSANGAVKLLNDPPIPTKSLVTFLHDGVKAFPDRKAFVVKREGQNVTWTYQQYWDDVRVAAKGFIKLGLNPFHGVCILGFNSPEWIISHYAAIFAGGFPAGIYTTNSPAACFQVLNSCDANILVVENEKQLAKILSNRNNLPHLKAIIQYTGTPILPDVLSWNDLLLIGQSLDDKILDTRIKGLATNQCAVLIYTSGTTGNPKAVMLSHDNIIVMAHNSIIWMTPKEENHRIVSYLPLSHLAAIASDIYNAVQYGATLYFATPDALKGKMIDVLREVQPTLLLAVPRIIEKMYEKIQLQEKSMNWLKKQVFNWAKDQALDYHQEHKQKSQSLPSKYMFARDKILNKVKTAMGLQHLQAFTCGGAPLAPEIKEYFRSLDLLILEGYGLSESSALHVGITSRDNNCKSVGSTRLFQGNETKILEPDEEGNGEILIRGRQVFMGYLKLEEETKETIDKERWVHSGDIGAVDENGYMYITGRIKELVITAGGENIPPLFIEDIIKKNLPVLSNCMLIGDKRKYLTVLITLKTEMDLETFISTDQLAEEAISWCQSIGSRAKRLSDIVDKHDPNVLAHIQAGITKYNEESAISNAQKVQKWTILPQDFSIGNGDLGPTLKLRRHFILKKYSDIIEKMYRQ